MSLNVKLVWYDCSVISVIFINNDLTIIKRFISKFHKSDISVLVIFKEFVNCDAVSTKSISVIKNLFNCCYLKSKYSKKSINK